jgi:hypothetical protein
MHGNRPVYQRVGGAVPSVQYAYYWPSAARWLIGNNISTGKGYREGGGAHLLR